MCRRIVIARTITILYFGALSNTTGGTTTSSLAGDRVALVTTGVTPTDADFIYRIYLRNQDIFGDYSSGLGQETRNVAMQCGTT